MRDTREPLPAWTTAADVVSLALLAVGVWALAVGGGVVHLAHLRISVRDPWRPWLWTAVVIAVRHAIVPRPALPERIGGALHGLALAGRPDGRAVEHRSTNGNRSRSSVANPRPRYRADIDGLRAIAVLAVIVYHANLGWMPGGFIGVDVFFVISGFLISGLIVTSLEGGAFSIADFYARRIRRIFPALIVVLAAVWIVGWVVLLPDAYEQVGRHIAGGAGFIGNFVLWRESGYFDRAAEYKPLLHLWSLGVEEQFYLLWPALLLVCWRRGVNLAGALGAIAAASFLANVVAVRAHAEAAFYLPATRVWELALGGLLAIASRRPPEDATGSRSPALSNAGAALGVALILASAFLLDRTRAFPGWWALFPTVGTVLVIWAGNNAWINRRALSNRPLVFVGLISYPLYLWHWPLLSYARILTAGAVPPAWVAGLLAAGFMLASATYLWLERPIRFAGPRLRRRIVINLAVGLAAVGLTGVWTDGEHGVPRRFAAALQPITSFAYDYGPDYRAGRCFLTESQAADALDPGCVDPPTSRRAPLFVLWGDSHAAHLYPGLRDLQHTHPFRIAQFTASGCPPMAVVSRSRKTPDRPQCPAINAQVAATILSLKPATVILAAEWGLYPDRSPVARTIRLLRDDSVQRIVLIGPVPSWTHALPQVLVMAFNQDPLHRIPTRTSLDLVPDVRSIDTEMRDFAERMDIVYVSPLDILCDRNGCVTRADDQNQELVTWDDTHLTAAGSDIVMKAAARELFSDEETGGGRNTVPR